MPKELPLREEVDRARKLIGFTVLVTPFDRVVSGVFNYVEAIRYADGGQEVRNPVSVQATEAQLAPFLGDAMWMKVSTFAHKLADEDEAARLTPSYPIPPPAELPVDALPAEQPPVEQPEVEGQSPV